ncbi:DUF427 domain-containing protein [Mesorhizobium sp. VK23B]|uniref:DUF427 domain-containing protein n=1 Tax=Mesorhizobium dulcispinae TaxID=3072316 RepID=A0ABU4XPH4_9HYPH|nr:MULTISPECIES: DUF427 domain-containing protein [unclassified Mesorhizobium]MDX8470293.1 DUF427 domain-containing protein [Mesorhizobium sp. VK23B]MDX8476652.1 DUF427 domain-containing protein [Mesorhizobium sp. VK23A]
MNERPSNISGDHYPIVIEADPEHVVVRVAGYVVAHSRRALKLLEAFYDPVLYIPAEDVDFTLLELSQDRGFSHVKGETIHYNIAIGGAKSVNAAWEYEDPHLAVLPLKDHVAFHPDRVDSITYYRGKGNSVDVLSGEAVMVLVAGADAN